MLTRTSRACSRSAFALTSRPKPSSVDDHASTGAFALMNAHLSNSSKRAKRTESSLSASLPRWHRPVSHLLPRGRAFGWQSTSEQHNG